MGHQPKQTGGEAEPETMKMTGRRRLPAILSDKSLNPPPPPRDRLGVPATFRSRSNGGGRRSGPTTPLLRWKFDEDGGGGGGCDPEIGETAEGEETRRKKAARRKTRRCGGGDGGAGGLREEARGGLWQMQLPESSSGSVRRGSSGRLGFEIEPSLTIPNSAMERATKWDPGCPKTSDEVYRFYDHMKFLEDHRTTTASIVSTLQAELEQARARIHDLESDRKSSKKKLDHFLKKLAEEKATWRSREHEKIRAIIDDMKDDLNRERKNRQRAEFMNSKLVSELSEAKLSAKRYLQDFEKERKARELMEEVCDELAKEIGEDKAEVEALKRESMKIREEVEEERKMLQMAEVWREERVQMKLVDAKLALEEKYSQLNQLQMNLEAFLRSRAAVPNATEDVKEAELLMEAVGSVNTQEIKDFTYQYQPPTSEDIFSVFEELQPSDANVREIEPCYGYSPASRASKVHTVSPEVNGYHGSNPVKRHPNGFIDQDDDFEDDSGWETVSQVEEQGSSNSPDGSNPSVNGYRRESNVSANGMDSDDQADNGTFNSEISEVCSATGRPSKKKGSSIARLWRSCPNNGGENYKTVSMEVVAANGRLSNARKSNGMVGSPDGRSADTGLSPSNLGQWSSPDSVNPHITRGMKGCIEWPRGIQKSSLKAKLLEARMESQKIQLRQVLKQKI
ncbi:hypothetical protein QJS10_CPB21g00935 [Acorus calamus]|uniref:Uncharacterized protein n=1 Tax=Acorus calamus TaxID=4465 RepID=A0AAV9C8U2_ACOCL|nr:hypothetical protein QJS10_CPB21g00935 [Acorus calamus]